MYMNTHLLHGLWLKNSGLHLWIEQVDGHKIVTPDSVAPDVFPPAIDALIRGKNFRHSVHTTLVTPKGREVKLHIPTLAFAPEQAVRVLSHVALINELSATPTQLATLAPDLKWLAHMYCGLVEFVKAGRLTIKLNYFDNQWYPTWQLASGLGERGWLAQMTHAAPGVLTANGGMNVAEDMAEELPHWIANSLLRPLFEQPRATEWHEFSHALLSSAPLRRGSAALVGALNKWKDSITAVDIKLVIKVEEPDRLKADVPTRVIDSRINNQPDDVLSAEDVLWPVRVQVQSGIDAPVPVRMKDYDSTTRFRVNGIRREAMFISRFLSNDYSAGVRAAVPSAIDGDFDVFLTIDELLEFINDHVARLRNAGIVVLLPKAWSTQEAKARVNVSVPTEDTGVSRVGFDSIVDFDWRISLGDVELTEEEMRALVNSSSTLIQLRGNWVIADPDSLRNVKAYVAKFAGTQRKNIEQEIKRLSTLKELSKSPADQEYLAQRIAALTATLDQPEDLSGRLSLAELRQLALESSPAEPLEFRGPQWQLAVLGQGNQPEFPAPQPVDIPSTVHARLREYQHRGVDWMYWMSTQHIGGILADDMGLGKTLQLLALHAVEKQEAEQQDAEVSIDVPDLRALGGEQSDGITSPAYGPSLVVAPTSVVGNWAKEAKKFVPSLKVLVHHGAGRISSTERLAEFAEYDLVVTSYGTATRDFPLLSQVFWQRVSLDEAQHIKNSSTQVARAVRSLVSKHRIALTGTPVENRLLELRAILDFCNPGMLGSVSFFRNHFAKPIEVTQDEVVMNKLKELTQPFILRRLKSDPAIVSDLPEKQEQIVTVEMTQEQTALYQAYVNELRQAIESRQGMKRKGLILSSLTKIKQICNHPAHFLGDGSAITIKGKHRSGKVQELMSIIDLARASGEKVLIFTQYKAFGDLLLPHLEAVYGCDIPFLHGQVSKSARDRMVDVFQSADGPPAMVLSLKAGGTGLNLTAANIVVHVDRWWNPAVENQATDRAYRIGQDRDVKVYKLITAGTLEEKIHHIITGKSILANTMVTQGEGWITELSDQQLSELLEYTRMDEN